MVSTKIILLGAGAVAAAYGASYLLKLNRLSNELEVVTKVAIHKVSLSGIDLRIDVTLKNPSGGTVNVKHPFVKMIYGSSTVASSQIKDVNITILKFSEVNLPPVMINIGYLTLATTVPALLREYRETGKLNLLVKTITTINDSIPFSKTDTITLGGGKEA
jgi:hypothetical protein